MKSFSQSSKDARIPDDRRKELSLFESLHSTDEANFGIRLGESGSGLTLRPTTKQSGSQSRSDVGCWTSFISWGELVSRKKKTTDVEESPLELKPGYLSDYISGQPIKATPEEVEAVQVFTQRLVEDYGAFSTSSPTTLGKAIEFVPALTVTWTFRPLRTTLLGPGRCNIT